MNVGDLGKNNFTICKPASLTVWSGFHRGVRWAINWQYTLASPRKFSCQLFVIKMCCVVLWIQMWEQCADTSTDIRMCSFMTLFYWDCTVPGNTCPPCMLFGLWQRNESNLRATQHIRKCPVVLPRFPDDSHLFIGKWGCSLHNYK